STSFFFFNATAPTDIYTLSLHDALPIYPIAQPGIEAPELAERRLHRDHRRVRGGRLRLHDVTAPGEGQQRSRNAEGQLHEAFPRSEEHTSELQSLAYLVCRLLLEKKKQL